MKLLLIIDNVYSAFIHRDLEDFKTLIGTESSSFLSDIEASQTDNIMYNTQLT